MKQIKILCMKNITKEIHLRDGQIEEQKGYN